MTTLFIDSATQSVYTDSRGTEEDSKNFKQFHVVKKGVYYEEAETIITGAGCLRLVEAAMYSGSLPTYAEAETNTSLLFVTKQVNGLLVCRYKPKPTLWDKFWLFFGCSAQNYERKEIALRDGVVLFVGSGLEYAQAAHAVLKSVIIDKEELVNKVYEVVATFDPHTDTRVVKYEFKVNKPEEDEEDGYAFGL